MRVYAGSLTDDEVRLVGARCAGPDDAHSLDLFSAIETEVLKARDTAEI